MTDVRTIDLAVSHLFEHVFRCHTQTPPRKECSRRKYKNALDEEEDLDADPAAIAQEFQIQRRIEQALMALSPSLRSTVVLVLIEGKPQREAAAILGCSEGTVAWRVHEARKQLREMLADLLSDTSCRGVRRNVSMEDELKKTISDAIDANGRFDSSAPWMSDPEARRYAEDIAKLSQWLRKMPPVEPSADEIEARIVILKQKLDLQSHGEFVPSWWTTPSSDEIKPRAMPRAITWHETKEEASIGRRIARPFLWLGGALTAMALILLVWFRFGNTKDEAKSAAHQDLLPGVQPKLRHLTSGHDQKNLASRGVQFPSSAENPKSHAISHAIDSETIQSMFKACLAANTYWEIELGIDEKGQTQIGK
ncbi:MAG: RNA polymerase sigma factor [Sandaracinaceae bacterium]|nr:RNA polymerase sigma factor [Sandaracinaceae bacterium]